MPQSREPSTPFRDATDLVPADIAFRRFCDIRFAELKTAIARAKETFHAEDIHMMERTETEFTELLRTGVPALIAVGDRERLIIPHETLETPRLALLFRKSGSQISGQEGPGFAAYAGRIATISQSQLDDALASKRPAPIQRAIPKAVGKLCSDARRGLPSVAGMVAALG